jgi:hypothetical protein
MALKRKTAETIPATLTVKGQGEEVKFNITYRNHKQSEVVAKLQEEGGNVADTVLFMVAEWDAEYPLTADGITEMEDERPGMVMAIIEGFHAARSVERVKN